MVPTARDTRTTKSGRLPARSPSVSARDDDWHRPGSSRRGRTFNESLTHPPRRPLPPTTSVARRGPKALVGPSDEETCHAVETGRKQPASSRTPRLRKRVFFFREAYVEQDGHRAGVRPSLSGVRGLLQRGGYVAGADDGI